MKETESKAALSSVLKLAANVLLVEDHVDTARTLGEFLIGEGFGVRVARSRDEALAVIDVYLYDFVIMDLYMPGLPAEEFVEQVKRRGRSQIILITAANVAEQQAQRLGIQAWLGKPFMPEQLIEVFRKLKS